VLGKVEFGSLTNSGTLTNTNTNASTVFTIYGNLINTGTLTPRDITVQGNWDNGSGIAEEHLEHTGSKRAQQILEQWATYRQRFVKVFPKEYRRALGELAAAQKKAAA